MISQFRLLGAKRPKTRKGEYLIVFLIAAMVGGFLGVCMMCLLQVARKSERRHEAKM
ncbi:MAG: DUF3789 domain-containing protein [Ruminococcus callidus]|nr:DUF3789 domain-containing protein [Ruminococcus callidus]